MCACINEERPRLFHSLNFKNRKRSPQLITAKEPAQLIKNILNAIVPESRREHNCYTSLSGVIRQWKMMQSCQPINYCGLIMFATF